MTTQHLNRADDRDISDALKPSGAPVRARSTSWGWIVVICLLLAGAGYWWFMHARASEQAVANSSAQAQQVKAIPVVAATARMGDMPIYVDALGTVTPLNVVTVQTRVDGQLQQIAFTEGQIVHQGELLAQIDPRPFQVQLEQAQAQQARDQAVLNNAQVDLERDKQAADAISKQQLATQATLVDQSAAAVKADQAQIDNAKLQLDYCRITAPITGKIGLRSVDLGNIIHASDPNGLAVITQIQPISVIFSIGQDHLPPVLKQTNRGARLQVEAYDPNLKTKLADGVLTAIDNRVDPTTATVRLWAEFTNEDNELFPSQFVNVRLLVDTVKNAVIVPEPAVQRGPDFNFVYWVKSDQTVDVQHVVLGVNEGDQRVIQSGLSAGQTVVTEGVDKLQQGAKVVVRPSGAGRSATGPSSQTSSAEPSR